jgi:hypothetical protein
MMFQITSSCDVYVTLHNIYREISVILFLVSLMKMNIPRTVYYHMPTIHAVAIMTCNMNFLMFKPLNEEHQDLKIIYSKYFSNMPSLTESIELINKGIKNYTHTTN